MHVSNAKLGLGRDNVAKVRPFSPMKRFFLNVFILWGVRSLLYTLHTLSQPCFRGIPSLTGSHISNSHS